MSEVGCAELTDEIRAKLAERIGREMLETARVQPFSVKGNVLRIERRAVDMLIRTMNAIVQSLYPTASVEVFGSFPTASWVPGASNLDIALSLPEAVTSDPQKKLDALNSLAVALRANPHWVNEVNVVPSPFRPLILLTTHSAFFQPPPPPQAAQGPRPPPGAPHRQRWLPHRQRRLAWRSSAASRTSPASRVRRLRPRQRWSRPAARGGHLHQG